MNLPRNCRYLKVKQIIFFLKLESRFRWTFHKYYPRHFSWSFREYYPRHFSWTFHKYYPRHFSWTFRENYPRHFSWTFREYYPRHFSWTFREYYPRHAGPAGHLQLHCLKRYFTSSKIGDMISQRSQATTTTTCLIA